MEELFKKIEQSKHIVIILKDDASIDEMASSNALYTYILQLHKKVSLYSAKSDFSINLRFLPWMDKLKNSYPASADLEIKAMFSIDLFNYFQKLQIKLNTKMATSLYAGLLDYTNGFRINIEGMIFAVAQVLVQNGADVSICNTNILDYQTLSRIRLKSILLKKMILKNGGLLAEFDLNDEDLKKSGADKKDSLCVLEEALSLPTVKKVKILYKKKVLEQRSEIA